MQKHGHPAPRTLWRASLLALGCEAAPNQPMRVCMAHGGVLIRAAAQPNGSKLPRHRTAPPQVISSFYRACRTCRTRLPTPG
ncbi:hypothetical protein DYL61_15295 [Pseudomonas nabeulensis]|uniref:Uncharacterized protein n=1 Tax=Pseudomonas nabeulensis TaxID=2293833 RepID=A0A4Z0B4N5_9PSED|nr:hypothetical protein DYL61_15295 [Pseudomonas nabeulensis]